MATPFKILGLDHIVLCAADPAALERFYIDVLGLTFEKRQDTLTQLRAGQARQFHRFGELFQRFVFFLEPGNRDH